MLEGIIFVIGLIWSSIALGVAWDARKHGGSFFKWFLLVGITGIFGLMWYSIAHSNARTPTINSDRTLLVSSEVTDVETGEKSTVQLSVNTDSTSYAIERFEEKCRDSGYQPTENPNVELQ